jgi:HEAT repeat protein
LTWAADTKIPLKQRRQAVIELAKRGDKQAVDRLKTIADAPLYLRYAAMQALGSVKNKAFTPQIASYLGGHLTHPDSQVADAAIRGLAALKGPGAVPALAKALTGNRKRPDGYEQELCTTIVHMMKAHGDKTAVPHLVKELHQVAKGKWGIGYGAEVIAALAAFKTPQAREAAGAYADRLTAEIPDDPLAKRYYETCIAEARAVAKP